MGFRIYRVDVVRVFTIMSFFISVLLLSSLPAGATTINEYTLTAASYPLGIATGPDGNVWFAEQFGCKIGRITTAGVITEFPLPGNSHPSGIAAGPDGNLWFTQYDGTRIGSIVRITTAGVVTEFPLPTDYSYWHYGRTRRQFVVY